MSKSEIEKIKEECMKKPPKIMLYDGKAQCVSEDYDDHGGGAFTVEVEATIYTSKDVNRLKKWLIKAESWIKHKESK